MGLVYIIYVLCVNSFRLSLLRVCCYVDVRYFTAMQWCLYDSVMATCGPEAAARHVKYNIILWQPPVTAFYCDLGTCLLDLGLLALDFVQTLS